MSYQGFLDFSDSLLAEIFIAAAVGVWLWSDNPIYLPGERF